MKAHVTLFAGIGADTIASAALGYTVTHAVEIDPFCQSILALRHPGATLHDDVCAVGAAELGVGMDLLSGGFPCQDLSTAGAGAGLEGARSGLWFEFLRIIRECRPRKVLIENVAALRSRGLDVVVEGLRDAGYGCWWDCVPALAVGAPHIRDRIWIVAVPLDEMPLRPAERMPLADGDKMPRAGYADHQHVYEVPPQATRKACLAALGAVKRDDGVTWLTKIDQPLLPTPVAHDDGKSPAAHIAMKRRMGRSHITSLSVLARNSFCSASGQPLWPTPTTQDASNNGGPAQMRTAVAATAPGALNPDWVEWLMGLPIGWTDPDCAEPVQSDWLSEYGIPRVAAAVPNRKQRLMACGNALVWRVAYMRLAG